MCHSLIGSLLFFFLCNTKMILIIKGILDSMKYSSWKNWFIDTWNSLRNRKSNIHVLGCQSFTLIHCWKCNLKFDPPNIGVIALSCFHYDKNDFFKRAHKSNEHESWWKQWVHTPIHTVNISTVRVNSLSVLCHSHP